MIARVFVLGKEVNIEFVQQHGKDCLFYTQCHIALLPYLWLYCRGHWFKTHSYSYASSIMHTYKVDEKSVPKELLLQVILTE